MQGTLMASHPPARVLVVDDEPITARTIAAMTRHFGHDVVVTQTLEAALAQLDAGSFDVVLTDLHLGRGNGLDLLREIQQRTPDVPVVMITGYATMDSAMEAIQAGAYDYLAKPPTLASLGTLLDRAIEKRRVMAAPAPEAVAEPATLAQERPERMTYIAGQSAQMLDVFKMVARVAPRRTSVLIFGESGTGKELVARSIHLRSPRSERRFVPVNVSAIPEGLLETELFGHVRGAFTGATTTRRGLFEEAHQGTLFLDEIGDLSQPLQAKLLRVLQEHRIKPVGGNEEIDVDVRVVAATHQDLQALVHSGRFREDLFYRLNVVNIALPPLRERPEDVSVLLEHFLKKYSSEYGNPPKRFSSDAEQRLRNYAWPGNVRELANVVERAVVLSTSPVISAETLPPMIQQGTASDPARSGALVSLDELTDRYVQRVLEHTEGNFTKAAKILGISRRTLHRMSARKRDPDPADRDKLSRDGSV